MNLILKNFLFVFGFLSLEAALKESQAVVWYVKKNGQLARRYATKNISLIPYDKRPKGGNRPSPKYIPYYDQKRKKWGQFTPSKLKFIVFV